MSLTSALSVANSGLTSIDAQFAVLTQNVANVGTPGYAAETGNQQSVTAGGVGMGARAAPATLATDTALQTSLVAQNAATAGLQTTVTALQAIDAALGTPGQGNDLGSLVGDLRDSFSTLMNDPSNQTQQSNVVASASQLASGINSLAHTYTEQRQAAQDDLGSSLTTLNGTLGSIGQINQQIMSLRQEGLSTADLENKRNALVTTLSGLVNIHTTVQANGNLSIVTDSGLVLPTDGSANFSITGGATPPEAYYPGGGLSGIMLNGKDVTSQLTGGQIGADVTLRDTTLPTDQAELDEFANGLANRFSAQGLTLFTDQSGNLPASGSGAGQAGYVGFSSVITVNPAVAANPSLVRDGTNAVPGDPNGASAFTPNPAGGPSGFTALISRVLNYTFTGEAQAGVAQPAMNTQDLGPAGTLNAPFQAAASFTDYAVNLVASQSQQSAAASNDLATATGLQSTLNSKLSSETGVDLNTEMSRMLTLQNAYGANARVISALQAMFNEILQVVQ